MTHRQPDPTRGHDPYYVRAFGKLYEVVFTQGRLYTVEVHVARPGRYERPRVIYYTADGTMPKKGRAAEVVACIFSERARCRLNATVEDADQRRARITRENEAMAVRKVEIEANERQRKSAVVLRLLYNGGFDNEEQRLVAIYDAIKADGRRF